MRIYKTLRASACRLVRTLSLVVGIPHYLEASHELLLHQLSVRNVVASQLARNELTWFTPTLVLRPTDLQKHLINEKSITISLMSLMQSG
jgi:hypothetical protein